ncbi:hypothetical protein O9992_21600 [Vibrio lentus]|nr:hypothetical protein [Vibrio lentus]
MTIKQRLIDFASSHFKSVKVVFKNGMVQIRDEIMTFSSFVELASLTNFAVEHWLLPHSEDLLRSRKHAVARSTTRMAPLVQKSLSIP